MPTNHLLDDAALDEIQRELAATAVVRGANSPLWKRHLKAFLDLRSALRAAEERVRELEGDRERLQNALEGLLHQTATLPLSNLSRQRTDALGTAEVTARAALSVSPPPSRGEVKD